MKTPLFTASSIAELGSATLILDSERRHIAEANGAPDAQFIVRACNSHAQFKGLALLCNAYLEPIADGLEICHNSPDEAKALRQLLERARAALTAAQS